MRGEGGKCERWPREQHGQGGRRRARRDLRGAGAGVPQKPPEEPPPEQISIPVTNINWQSVNFPQAEPVLPVTVIGERSPCL